MGSWARRLPRPHFALRTSHFALRTPHFALRTPHSAPYLARRFHHEGARIQQREALFDSVFLRFRARRGRHHGQFGARRGGIREAPPEEGGLHASTTPGRERGRTAELRQAVIEPHRRSTDEVAVD